MSTSPPDRYARIVPAAALAGARKQLLLEASRADQALTRVSGDGRCILWARVPYGEDPAEYLPPTWRGALRSGQVLGHYKNGWSQPGLAGEIVAVIAADAEFGEFKARPPTAAENEALANALKDRAVVSRGPQ